MPPPISLPLTVTIFALPPLLLTTYLYNYPLSPRLSRSINISNQLPPSTASSRAHKLTNPKNHVGLTDSITFTLPSSERRLSDTQLLSRFLRGFFTGTVFYPESLILSFLRKVGSSWLVVGVDGIPTHPSGNGEILEFSGSEIPPLYSVFLDHFMILDSQILSPEHSSQESEREAGEGREQQSSYVDIAFGDNRKRFGGFHRIEILRGAQEGALLESNPSKQEAKNEMEVTVRYSCMACDPQVDGWRPLILWHFHRFYALSLFRDGIREVLSD